MEAHPYIVFTQFTMTAKVLGLMLDLAGVGFVYLVGETTQQRSDETIEIFGKDPEYRVMVRRPTPISTIHNVQAF